MAVPDIRQWAGRRACKDSSPAMFFPEDREETSHEAFALCFRCECRAVCSEYAIEQGEVHGIWGGLTQAERRKIISAREIITRNSGVRPSWMHETPSCLTDEGPTERGYRVHIIVGEVPCDGCREAHRRNQISYRAKKEKRDRSTSQS